MQKLMGCSKSNCEKKFIAMNAYIKKQKMSNKQPTSPSQGTRKEKMEPNVSRRKEVLD